MAEHKIRQCGKVEGCGLSGKYWPVKWANQVWGEGGGAALLCQEIGGSGENFQVTIAYPEAKAVTIC
jgi:hypothetical protein